MWPAFPTSDYYEACKRLHPTTGHSRRGDRLRIGGAAAPGVQSWSWAYSESHQFGGCRQLRPRVIVADLDGRMAGMALLCVCTTLAGQFGLVEEVAVDEAARGNHVGVELMVTVLETAQRLGWTSSS